MHDVSAPAEIFPSHPGRTLHTLLNSHTDSSETQFPKSILAVTSSLSIGLQRNNGGCSFGVFWGSPAQVRGGQLICSEGDGEDNFIISTQDKLSGQWRVVFLPPLFTAQSVFRWWLTDFFWLSLLQSIFPFDWAGWNWKCNSITTLCSINWLANWQEFNRQHFCWSVHHFEYFYFIFNDFLKT